MIASSDALATLGLFIACLSALLIGIDFTTGVLRVQSRQTPNPEDARTVMKGAVIAAEDVEAVARAGRAHRNAMANVVPFVLIMAAYVLLGASRSWVIGLCAPFTAARFVHAVAYIRGLQPWRSLSYFVATFCLAVALVQLIRVAMAT